MTGKKRAELMDSSRFRSILILLALSLLIPSMIFARGAAENDKPYGIVLDEEFSDLLDAVEGGEISVSEAARELQSVRQDYGREDNEEYQRMEQILEAVQTKTMTMTQAREEFYPMDEACEGLDAEQLQEREKLMQQLKNQNRNQVQTQAAGENAGDVPAESPATPADGSQGSGSGK
jgi:hypothetical protein